jgi:hypothetical protein
MSANEWQSLLSRFRDLARSEEQRLKRKSPRRDDRLTARCDYAKQAYGVWTFDGGDGYTENPFRALAALAGNALGLPKDVDGLNFWLHRLYQYLRENYKEMAVRSDEIGTLKVVGKLYVDDSGHRRYLDPTESNGAYLFAASDERGVILRVCEASAVFCDQLESDATLRTLQTKSKPEVKLQLTDRELKIRAVIERGATGLQYCRELDNAGIAPLRSGVWKDCPSRKYASAYREGGAWPHRIQDEKSKVKRKARLATLASE